MNLATNLQEKLDEVYWDNCNKDSKLKKCKANGAALLCGAIDGAVLIYPFMFAALIVANKKIRDLSK